MLRSRPLAYLAVTGSVTLAFLLGLTLLPHSRYIRFQQTAVESLQLLRVKWIYQRIHFDPTPIDVAFIGTSHTQSSIDAELVEAAAHEHGHDWHVVNFAVPWLGRDLHYLIARELLENRRVSKLVVEVQESEPRAPHPAFLSLAELGDVVATPAIVNVNYLDNFARLPLRQASLFVRTLAPSLFGLESDFDPAHYEGLYWNDTYRPHGFNEARTAVHTAEHFAHPVSKLWAMFESKQSLGRRLNLPGLRHSLPYRYNLLYLERLLALAQEKGVEIVFYFVPFFTGPKAPADQAVLSGYGPILSPQAVLNDPGSWQNEDHLNVFGARDASRWMGRKLAEMPR